MVAILLISPSPATFLDVLVPPKMGTDLSRPIEVKPYLEEASRTPASLAPSSLVARLY